jgi:hypothetical protein
MIVAVYSDQEVRVVVIVVVIVAIDDHYYAQSLFRLLGRTSIKGSWATSTITAAHLVESMKKVAYIDNTYLYT